MKKNAWLRLTTTMAVVSMVLANANSVSADFTIGSKAPALDVEHWLSNADGRLKEVKEFEEGKVYIVEFWATWCGPCVASMPHIVELQKKYLDKGVQVISVSDEDLETVEEFLGKEVPARIAQSFKKPAAVESGEKKGENKSTDGAEDEKGLTFRELTSGYCLTTDPDGSSHEDYMEAAGENGIPTAFIVGKSGLIEWIGHPMEIDEPLSQIVADSWDRDAYLKEREEAKELQNAIQEVLQAAQSGEGKKAVELLDSLIGKVKDENMTLQLQSFRVQLLLQTEPDQAWKAVSDVVKSTDNPQILNAIAWGVVEFAESTNDELDKALLKSALEGAEKAVKLDPKNGLVLDTLSHLVYLNGDLAKAIELERKAVELSPDVAELKEFLDSMLEEQKKGDEEKK